MKISSLGALAACILLAACEIAAQSARPAVAARPASAAPQLVILDTDIGDDIDDAFALALVVRSPELKLLGVTTEYGDTELRASLLARYLQAVGQPQIPIAAGRATPQANVFTQAAYARQAQETRRGPVRRFGDAVSFLFRQIREHPGQITLISIGPLVNVQDAIERDPATFRKLKRVVMMGGSVYAGYNDSVTGARRPPDIEWNIRCDPAGLKALLASGVPVFIMPLDSTQIPLPQPQMATIFAHGSPLTDQLTLLYHQWSGSGGWRIPTLYDPVAVSYAIRPDLCPVSPIRLAVDDRGFTRPQAGAANAQVCLHSDEDGFRRFLMNRIVGTSSR